MATDQSDIDAVFQLPLDEFTAARNALAATLKTAGRADEAARVKALPRPPVSAWAVNQLYWRHRKTFSQFMAAGEKLRQAQAARLRDARSKGADIREPLEARRRALSELAGHASALLKETGHTATPDLMRRMTTTLDALATYGERPEGPRPGRLTRDVDAPGFEALTSLVPRTAGTRGGQPTRVLRFEQRRPPKDARKKLDTAGQKRQREAERKARLAAAAAALRTAERALVEARKTAAGREATLRTAAARAKHTEQKKEALAARLEKAAADADHARQQARRIAAEAEEAAQAVEDAERALDEARRARKSLT